MDAQKKKCTWCAKNKFTEEFYSKGDRLDSRCKACVLQKKINDRKKKKVASNNKVHSKKFDILNLDVIEVYVTHLESTSREDIVKTFIEMTLCGGIHDEEAN